MHSLISGLPVPAGKPEAERSVFRLYRLNRGQSYRSVQTP